MYLETHFHRLRRKIGPMVRVLLLISFLAVFYEKNRQGFLNVDQYDSIKYYWKSWVGWSYCSLTSATLWSVKWYMSQWWLVIQSCKLFSVILIYLTCWQNMMLSLYSTRLLLFLLHIFDRCNHISTEERI